MSSKPETASAASPSAAMPVWDGGAIEIAGTDAVRFAQAQLMNDVRALADGQWQWSGWLSAKGRVIALGALLRVNPERLLLLLPDHPAATLRDELQRYVMRSKVRLSLPGAIAAFGVLQPPAQCGTDAQGARAAHAGGVWHLDLGGVGARTLLVGEAASIAASGWPTCTPQAWALEDLAHGLPRLGPTARETLTPQMLSLDRLGAYSVSKGCYPGQEIVARTHFLGQAKRRLMRLLGSGPLAPGEVLAREDGSAVGEVLSAASSGSRHEALAVLPNDVAEAAWLGAGAAATPARVTDFAEGLRR